MIYIYNYYDGLIIQDLENEPNSEHLLWSEENQQKIDTFTKPYIVNGEIVDTATPEEIKEKEKLKVPNEVALWKLRFILSQMGLEVSVSDAISQLPEPQKTAATYIWNYGTAVDRYSNTVLFLQQALQLNDDQTDEIFIQASQVSL
jgi:hypothetical protein